MKQSIVQAGTGGVEMRGLKDPRRQRTVAAMAIATVVAAGALTACGSGGGSGGGSDIKIGAVLPLTGALAPYAPATRKASELALEQVQAALKEAGVDDVSVSMSVEDFQTSEQGAVQSARKAISEGANVLVGIWTSGGVLAAAKAVTVRQGVPLISPTASSTDITKLDDDGLVSRLLAADNVQAMSVAQVAAKELGPKAKLSLAGVNEAYGAGFARNFKQVWEAGGGTTTGTVLYDPTAPEFDSEAGDIVAGNPDGFVFFSYPDSFAKLSRSLLRTGKYDGTRSFFSESLASLDTLKGTGILPAVLAGGKGTLPTAPTTTDAARAFDELYKKSSRKPAEHFSYDTHSFDTVILAALAGIAAKSDDPRAIGAKIREVASPPGKQYTFQQLPEAIKALRDGQDIDYEGVSGPVNLDENGDLEATAAYFKTVTYSADGVRKPVNEFHLDTPAG
jgi:ABC-type branched-subunit amino acid transport system substrate-binding protein